MYVSFVKRNSTSHPTRRPIWKLCSKFFLVMEWMPNTWLHYDEKFLVRNRWIHVTRIHGTAEEYRYAVCRRGANRDRSPLPPFPTLEFQQHIHAHRGLDFPFDFLSTDRQIQTRFQQTLGLSSSHCNNRRRSVLVPRPLLGGPYNTPGQSVDRNDQTIHQQTWYALIRHLDGVSLIICWMSEANTMAN